MTGPSKSQINKAGALLGQWHRGRPVSSEGLDGAWDALRAHRMNHQWIWFETIGFLNPRIQTLRCWSGFRLKREARIIEKLARPNPPRLCTMRDIAGARLRLSGPDSLEQQNRVVLDVVEGLAHRGLETQTIQFVENPRSTGYRAIHVVVLGPDSTFAEIQVRTWYQHLWANTAESLQDAGFGDIKSDDMGDELRALLMEFSVACHDADCTGDEAAKLRAFEAEQALLNLPRPKVG